MEVYVRAKNHRNWHAPRMRTEVSVYKEKVKDRYCTNDKRENMENSRSDIQNFEFKNSGIFCLQVIED